MSSQTLYTFYVFVGYCWSRVRKKKTCITFKTYVTECNSLQQVLFDAFNVYIELIWWARLHAVGCGNMFSSLTCWELVVLLDVYAVVRQNKTSEVCGNFLNYFLIL